MLMSSNENKTCSTDYNISYIKQSLRNDYVYSEGVRTKAGRTVTAKLAWVL